MQLVVVLVWLIVSASSALSEAHLRSLGEYFPSEVFWDTLKPLVDQPKTHIELGEVELAFDLEAAKPEELDFIIETFSMGDKDTSACSFQMNEWLSHFMMFIELQAKPACPATQYVNHVAADKIEQCASQFDSSFKRRPEYRLEWTLDGFFERLADPGGKASAGMLLREAERFDFDREIHPEQEVCRLAAAFNLMRRRYPAPNHLTGGWLSSLKLKKKLANVTKDAEAKNCEQEVWEFFDKTCGADSLDHELDLIVVNMAIAFGAEPARLMGRRTRKYREYKRICYTFNLRMRPHELDRPSEPEGLVE